MDNANAQTRSAVAPKERRRGAALLWAIGIFKLLKSLALVVGAISVFNLSHKNLVLVVVEWSKRLHIAPGNHIVERLVDRVLTIDPKQLIVLGYVLLAYAVMFTVEGIGLVLLKTWAEWMAVITTSGLIPLEAYEIAQRPGPLKVAAMAINMAIALYLFFHVRRESKLHRAGQISSN